MYKLGIDVSHWQGKMDWDIAVAAGVKFALLKITEGTNYYDDTFAYNYDRCMNLDVPVGYYHFVRSNIDAASQFKWLKSKLPNIANTNIALDCEQHAGQMDANKTTDTIIGLSSRIYDLVGAYPIIYTSPGYAKSYLLPWNLWKKHRLWIAHWTTASQPTLPSQWDKWFIWQFTIYKPGSYYGASSQGIDLNRMIDDDIPTPPTSDVVANISVNIDGVTYTGIATLNKQV